MNLSRIPESDVPIQIFYLEKVQKDKNSMDLCLQKIIINQIIQPSSHLHVYYQAQWTTLLEYLILKNIGIIALMIGRSIRTIIFQAPYRKN